MLKAEDYISLVRQRGSGGKTLERVFRNMLNPELFRNAYGRLYQNKGSMTPGVDDETPDGMSLPKIDALIEELRTGKFRWTPNRRVYIEKGQGKTRPLSLPTWKDKLVQEVMRVILEAYYEPQFSKLSHGFRPNRGCHTALKTVSQWGGVKWFIEGDIKGCFDNIDHGLLIKVISRKIRDDKFLKLLRHLLKAGYLEDWKYHNTYSGTPQGGVISPLLANIFLNEFDQWMDMELMPEYTRGRRRKTNPEYSRLRSRICTNRRGKKTPEQIKEWTRQRKQLPTRDPYDPNYRRIWYVRYADDFLVGFIGPKAEAEQIRTRIKARLGQMELTLSTEKTKITHAPTERAEFLSYEITFPNHLRGNRRLAGKATFLIPRKVLTKWKAKYQQDGQNVSHRGRANAPLGDIFRQYDAEIRGLWQYYQYALNASRYVSYIRYIAEQSLVATLAHKLRTKKTTVYRRFSYTGVRKCLGMTTEKGTQITFGNFTLHRSNFSEAEPIHDLTFRTYYGRKELVRRLERGICEIEGCEAPGEEVHHIRAMKDLNKWKKRGVNTSGLGKINDGNVSQNTGCMQATPSGNTPRHTSMRRFYRRAE